MTTAPQFLARFNATLRTTPPTRFLAITGNVSILGLASVGVLVLAAGIAPALVISTPTNGDEISGDNFTASGFMRGGTELSARIVTSQGELTGQPVTPMEKFDWSFQFSAGLSLDENVTLYVRCTTPNGFTEESRMFHWKSR